MGVLTDFVVANRHDSERVCDSDCPSQDFAGRDAKGIDTVKLGTLHAILTGADFDPSFMSDCLCSRGEDGPWVFEVPSDMVKRLAALTAQDVSSVGRKWAATEEFSTPGDSWPIDAVEDALRNLTELCNQATDEGKTVLMWMCL